MSAAAVTTSFILKPARHADWFVLWSTLTRAPVYWGSRADFARLRHAFNINDIEPDRIVRADKCGSSDPGHSWDAMKDDPVMVLDAGHTNIKPPRGGHVAVLPIDRIWEFCERWDRGERREDLVEWRPCDE